MLTAKKKAIFFAGSHGGRFRIFFTFSSSRKEKYRFSGSKPVLFGWKSGTLCLKKYRFSKAFITNV